MGKPSLRKALLVAALLGLFIPATLFTLYESYVQFDQETERHVRARMAQYSEILKSGIALAIWTADYPYANELAAAVLNDPDVAEVIVEDEFDEVIVALSEDIERSDSQTSAQFDITFDGHRLGSLRLGITSTNIQQALRNKLLVQGLLLLCQLLLSAILIFLLIERRIVQPLLTLQRSAERVAKGDMSRSLKSTRRDEIGVLYDAFNTMRENLSGLLSAKERSAKELRKSEERFRIISSIANDLIFTGQQLDNGETRLDWMAGDAPGIFGCGVDQVVAEGGFLPFVCTEQRTEFLSAMEKLKPDHPVELQLGIDTIDGRRRTVHFRAELIGTSSARKRPTLYGVVRDITEQIASEKALRLADAVYRNSGQAIAIVDERLRIIAVNPAFTAITGYAFDDVRHRPPGILFSNQRGRELLLAINEAIAQTGRWEGETWHQRKDGEEYAAWLSVDVVRDEDGEIRHYVAMFHDITEKKRADALIWEQANYDQLTRLPNRRLFADRLAQDINRCRRDNSLLAVLFIDLDRFKEVNDCLGHDLGDELLLEAAKRLQRCLRTDDTVARIGGDEFTVTLPGLAKTLDIEPVITAILRTLAEPYRLGDEDAFVSASIGVACFPDDADSVTDLLKGADQAMYNAKRSGRNRFCYYTAAMEKASQVRMHLISALHQAIDEKQFIIYYQPIVDLETGRIIKAEALLRWRHPEHGMISPGAFIPLAEETGTINDIGNWVFREAVRNAAVLQPLICPDFQISINISPVQLRHPDRLCAGWIDFLREQTPCPSVVIEITEGVLLQGDDIVDDQLRLLRDAGVQCAVDDFGTGYSSLSYLKKFSIDYVKIDQSFTRNLGPENDSLALCEAIVVMAHKLGLRVIAEGIETAEQRRLLLEIGCDFGQGYLYGKPMPIDEFEKLVGNREATTETVALIHRREPLH